MILLYPGNDEKQAETAKTILQTQNIPYVLVTDADEDTPIATLTGGNSAGTGTCSRPLFLFYDDTPRDELFALDGLLKGAGVDTSRKAARTENNVQWPLKALMDEVAEEARWFALRQELMNLVMAPDKERLKSDPAYLNLMSAAYNLLQDESAVIADLEAALHTVKEA